MFKASLVRAAEVSSIPMKPHVNPYTAQKIWPPDFTKMHPKHQFRLERRYRRRAKLKWARPRWVKATKLAQWGICSGKQSTGSGRPLPCTDRSPVAVVVYGVLWMDWGTVETPFPSVSAKPLISDLPDAAPAYMVSDTALACSANRLTMDIKCGPGTAASPSSIKQCTA